MKRALAILVMATATAEGFLVANPYLRPTPASFRAPRPEAPRGRGLSMHTVTIEHLGKATKLQVEEYTSILEAALDAGIDLPHDCKLGVCLTCPSRVVSGDVDQSAGTLEDSVIAQGYALTCCAYPRSDVVIRSIDEDELVGAQFEKF